MRVRPSHRHQFPLIPHIPRPPLPHRRNQLLQTPLQLVLARPVTQPARLIVRLHRRHFVLVRMKRVEVRKHHVPLNLPGVAHLQVVRVGVHRAHRTVDRLFAGRKVQRVAQRFRHLGAAVDAGQAAGVAQHRPAVAQHRGGQQAVHLVHNLVGLLNHRQLVVADGHALGLKRRDVRRLADGVGHKPDRQRAGKPLLHNLVFHRRVTLHAGDGDDVHIQHRQLGEGGQGGLQADRGQVRVDARGEVVGQHFGDVVADFLRVAAVVGQPLEVGNQHKLAVSLLERHALAQRADEVAEVQRAGWAVAGEDGGCVHKDSLMCSCRKGS